MKQLIHLIRAKLGLKFILNIPVDLIYHALVFTTGLTVLSVQAQTPTPVPAPLPNLAQPQVLTLSPSYSVTTDLVTPRPVTITPEPVVIGVGSPSTVELPPQPPSAVGVPAVTTEPVLMTPSAGPDGVIGLRPISSETVENSLWERIRKGFSMPNLETQLATDKTLWYAKQPDYMARMTERGGQYLFHIVEELERRHMPTEIALLPFIESAFNPQAVSSAKAAGMWQFMPATAKNFNLKQNVWRDERRGVVESTRAALDYLQKLHDMFGDWHLALAAYNWGEGSVQRAINKNRAKGLSTEYTALTMPVETANYVPKFQAIKNIVQDPGAYGIRLNPLANEPYFGSVIKDRDIDVSLAAKFAGLTLNEFKALNPSFKKPVILGAQKPVILLPASKIATFNESLLNHKGGLSTWTTVTLSGTEKPAAFARRYGISEHVLRDVNNIPPKMLIKSGSTLVVPKNNPEEQTANIAANMDNAQVSFAPELVRRSVVARKGDSWAKLAKRTGISVASLRGWNRGVSAPRKGSSIVYYTSSNAAKLIDSEPVASTSRNTHSVHTARHGKAERNSRKGSGNKTAKSKLENSKTSSGVRHLKAKKKH